MGRGTRGGVLGGCSWPGRLRLLLRASADGSSFGAAERTRTCVYIRADKTPPLARRASRWAILHHAAPRPGERELERNPARLRRP